MKWPAGRLVSCARALGRQKANASFGSVFSAIAEELCLSNRAEAGH